MDLLIRTADCYHAVGENETAAIFYVNGKGDPFRIESVNRVFISILSLGGTTGESRCHAFACYSL